MKKVFFLLFALFSGSGSSAQWFPKNPGTEKLINATCFNNGYSGYAAGDCGTILKTDDGGNTWTTQSSHVNVSLYTVKFPAADTGFVAGDSGTILRTVDGGEHWEKLTSGVFFSLQSLYFTNTMTGFAVGDSGILLKTVDGGNNWMPLHLGTNLLLHSVEFPTPEVGYIGGVNFPKLVVFKTTDGGTSWNMTAADSIDGSNYSYFRCATMCFPDPDTGYITGIYSAYLEGPYYITKKTTDGGSAWELPVQEPWLSFVFTDGRQGYGVSGANSFGFCQSVIKHTSDGGMTWTSQDTLSQEWLISLDFPCRDTGYAAGADCSTGMSSVYKTTNGGYSGSPGDFAGKNGRIHIRPNPATSVISIESPVNGDLSIWNMNGAEVRHLKFKKPESNIDIETLPDGIYFVRLTSDKSVETGMFLKQ
jgi:photosystem II stability/assembly factor-like uncharacterized protein